jgi:hypothetical protein
MRPLVADGVVLEDPDRREDRIAPTISTPIKSWNADRLLTGGCA